jgi:deoxyhypusine monooxygenase
MAVPIKQVLNTSATYSSLEETLLNPAVALSTRFNALFQLKALNTAQAIDIIQKAFIDKSALLKHELAYVLGQMKNPYALPCLYSIVESNQDLMTRHEAAEAIGAIGLTSSISFLEQYLTNEHDVLRETCYLSIESIKQGQVPNKIYKSIDPAPALDEQRLFELEKMLLDQELGLFKRYRAMFSLRDIGTDEAVAVLEKGFMDSSALFRHEIAYVFGQMQKLSSVDSLVKVLCDTKEIGMVRHEAAEALGSIGTDECRKVLERFVHDKDVVVRESCLVGLGMLDDEFVVVQ